MDINYTQTFGPLTPQWKWLLASGNTHIEHYYKDDRLYGVITLHYDEVGVLMVNSATIRNEPFTFGMRRFIMKHVKAHNRAIISSTQKDSSINRYCTYDTKHQCFHKGL
jgi:hypothetical protein